MPSRDFDTAFWNDKFVRRLPPDGKLLFIYLWTNDMCSSSGMYEIDPDVVTLQTKLPEDKWRALLPELEKKVLYYSDDEREIVWVKNFFRRQCKNPMFASSAVGSLRNLPRDLVAGWLQYNAKTLKRFKVNIQSLDSPKTVPEQSKDNQETVTGQSEDSPEYGDSLETVSRQTGSPTTRSDQIRSEYPSDTTPASKRRRNESKDQKSVPHVTSAFQDCANPKCNISMPPHLLEADERGFCKQCQWDEERNQGDRKSAAAGPKKEKEKGKQDLDKLF